MVLVLGYGRDDYRKRNLQIDRCNFHSVGLGVHQESWTVYTVYIVYVYSLFNLHRMCGHES